ncbi:MHYT domain-containing protein [Jiangella mangrovi]|uniref:NO-binding membrane sensor protein with MHYT domain n=1 Tax=Jiangella mangrovi TaxID=1524084 RepID=A0A7W9GT92_9ACTN|nr:MHYT domain-containing protein [Jiangella mangrovi]MBB5789383.1 NO-binding membrane sensor protein with MHYT domain [Jiangella mangrovi]
MITGAASLAAGIWTLHFIAMLGFRVAGSPVRYNVSLTLISLVVAFLVVGLGVLMVGYGTNRNRSLAFGGLATGVGVAAMHYTGMASVQINGSTHYRVELVVASLAIAVAAATAALWLAFNIRSFGGAIIAALVMGVAVSSMHYTGMAAVSADLAPDPLPVAGATAMEFLVPLSIGLGALLLAGFTVIAVSPVELGPRDDDDDDEPGAEQRENLFAPPTREVRAMRERAAARPPAPPTPLRRAEHARPLPTRTPARDEEQAKNDPPVVQSWLTRPDSRS